MSRAAICRATRELRCLLPLPWLPFKTCGLCVTKPHRRFLCCKILYTSRLSCLVGVACPKVRFFIERKFQGILLLVSGGGRWNDGVELKTKDRGKMFGLVERTFRITNNTNIRRTNKTNVRRIIVNL